MPITSSLNNTAIAGVVDVNMSEANDSVRVYTDTGAPVATSAKQDTGNSSLTSIDNKLAPATAGTVTSVAASLSDTLILATNATRKGASVCNHSATAYLYLSLSTAASSPTNFTVAMAPLSYYETPAGYTGEIRGNWTIASGSARVTELV